MNTLSCWPFNKCFSVKKRRRRRKSSWLLIWIPDLGSGFCLAPGCCDHLGNSPAHGISVSLPALVLLSSVTLSSPPNRMIERWWVAQSCALICTSNSGTVHSYVIHTARPLPTKTKSKFSSRNCFGISRIAQRQNSWSLSLLVAKLTDRRKHTFLPSPAG